MIATLMRINWINLKRDYVALGLVFVLPLVFFSIFASIFGGAGSGGGDTANSFRIVVVDEDQTEISKRFAKAIDDQDALSVATARDSRDGIPNPGQYTRETARRSVRAGEFPAAVIIPKKFGTTFGDFTGDRVPVEVIYDEANPIAQNAVSGLMQAAAMMAAPDILMEKGVGQLARFGGGITPAQKMALKEIRPFLRGERSWDELQNEAPRASTLNDATTQPATSPRNQSRSGFGGMVDVINTPARQEKTRQGKPSLVAYYAAGIGVMFLLFSMVGASSSLLEEEATGTLERLLAADFRMGKLLAGSWLYYTMVGIVQVTLMFVFAALVFKLNLFTPHRLSGFAVMTILTSSAAAAFALILATACRSRAQLGGISTVIILLMSALGGSMVPRFIAPEFFNTTSRFTFNGWALDGYLKVFWHDDPLASVAQATVALWPQALALVGMTVVFLILSRVFARRWETI
jgi:ABC-2 type transport system permease protein